MLVAHQHRKSPIGFDRGAKLKTIRTMACTGGLDRPILVGALVCYSSPVMPVVRPGVPMKRPGQYSIRVLLFLMILVAHACSKRGIARTLHTGPIDSISTLTPFVITIRYSEVGSLDDHTKSYFGAFGQYWVYSHRITMTFGCFRSETMTTDADEYYRVLDGANPFPDCGGISDRP
jgi:hypothetical protein